MADYTNSKFNIGSVFPEHAIDAMEWSRVEPLITPDQLRRRFLLGIPLISFIPNPITNERDEWTNEDLADHIIRAVAEVELETGLTIFPVQFDEKHPFDRNWWAAHGYVRVWNRPVSSVDKLAFTPANNQDIFVVNKDWIEAANFHKGQINLIPMVPAVAATFISGSNLTNQSGAAYLQLFQGLAWIPAIVRVVYTCGFPDGRIPRILNELIGVVAALDILSGILPTFRGTSYSLNIDGMGQSQSFSPQVLLSRIEFLTTKKDSLVKKLKNVYGLNIHGDWA